MSRIFVAFPASRRRCANAKNTIQRPGADGRMRAAITSFMVSICGTHHVQSEFNGVLLLAESTLADRAHAYVNVSGETFSADMEVVSRIDGCAHQRLVAILACLLSTAVAVRTAQCRARDRKFDKRPKPT
jgi:hypothetical protein